MIRRTLCVAAVLAAFLTFTTSSPAAAPFYEGKTVRVTVGFSAGGGFDMWARAVARHIGRHIPGKPTVIVENITGAGGLIQTNNLFKATKADGLTIGHINGGLILGQILGQPGYDFDSQKFVYIGSANKENTVICLSTKSGIDSAEKWRTATTPVKLGGLVPGNFIDNIERAVKDVLGFPTQVITGYKGSADIRIAAESGELAGGAASWDSVKTSWKRSLDSGDMKAVLQSVPARMKDLPDVPRLIEFAKTDDQKNLIQIIVHYANDYSRPFAVPPGTPKDRVEILRKAFQETMKDTEFIAEIDKMQMTLEPLRAEDLTAAVAGSAKIDQAMRARLKDILFK
jgi:tripartite-type tricarboxylate transporter receptor subunit TctC